MCNSMLPTKRKLEDQKTGGRGKKEKRQWRRKAKWQKQAAKRERKGEGGAGYQPITKENALLEKYYQGQKIILTEEWGRFLATMRESLPATFRITGTRSLAENMLTYLENRVFVELMSLEVEGERVPPPLPLPWYPNRLAWHVPLTKKFIRKSPLLSKFHAFLVRENNQGNITRQEAVSMIPPLLLDIHHHHRVLDMCAAPGSKTAQLIEFLHAEDTETSTIPSGVVVANDADNKRCYMLVHQAKRLNSPCFMVTNHDASVFPTLYYHDDNDVRHPLYYDRVLCDVPCSGDGTLRKNPVIWRQWIPSLAPALHKLQLRILSRGLEVLCPGGRLVYSTCSLNPVEDEAVIATALKLCKGSVELLDCSEQLPGLKRVPGVTTWKVMSKTGEWVPSHADIPPSQAQLFTPTVFPPDQQELGDLHLERCMRVLPHHQDTGGFFIAVLQKRDWLPWQRKRKLAKVTQELTARTSDITLASSAQNTDCSPQETTNSVQDTTTSVQDTATSVQDTATSVQDTATSVQDTATSVQDTTTSVQDTTTSVQDTTTSVQDTATSVQDTATSVQDTTTSVQDTTTSVQDTTTSVQDTATSVQDTTTSVRDTATSVQDTTTSVRDTTTLPKDTICIPQDTVNSGTKHVSMEGAGVMELESVPQSSTEDVPTQLTQAATEPSEEGRKEATADIPPEDRPPVSVLGRPGSQQRHNRGFKEDPYVFFGRDSDICQTVKTYYGLPDSFPSDQLLTRTYTGKKRNIYLASKLVKELTRRNELSVKIINTGVKVLARCDHPKTSCPFRLSQEGVETMMAFVTSHCVSVTLADLATLLQEPNPLVSELSQLAQDTIKTLGIGPVLFKYSPDSEASSQSDASTSHNVRPRCPMHLSGWVAAKSVRLYVDKNYRYHYLVMLGYDPPENQSLETISRKRRKEQQLQGDWEEGEEEEGGGSSEEEMLTGSVPEDVTGNQQGSVENLQSEEAGEDEVSEREPGSSIESERPQHTA